MLRSNTQEPGIRKRRAGTITFHPDTKQILLVGSSAFPGTLILPAGTIEPGETPEAAAVRETEEEAGVTGILGESLGVDFNPSRLTATNWYVMQHTKDVDEWSEAQRKRWWLDPKVALQKLGRIHQRAVLRKYIGCAFAEKEQFMKIESLWNGEPISDEEVVHITVAEGDNIGSLWICIESPYYGDAAPAFPKGSSRYNDGLWNYEVVEVFVSTHGRGEDDADYLELEFSPHGQYLALQLHGKKNVVKTFDDQRIRYDAAISMCGSRWLGVAQIPKEMFPPLPHALNVYAIHGSGDQRRYLAMTAVPGDQPDFHRLSYFKPAKLPFGSVDCV